MASEQSKKVTNEIWYLKIDICCQTSSSETLSSRFEEEKIPKPRPNSPLEQTPEQ